MAEASPSTARFPLAVKQLLEQALGLRDRYLEQKISLHGLWTATGRLEAKLDRMLVPAQRAAANQRLANHLRHERPYLFTFLYCPGLVDATNNVAFLSELGRPATLQEIVAATGLPSGLVRQQLSRLVRRTEERGREQGYSGRDEADTASVNAAAHRAGVQAGAVGKYRCWPGRCFMSAEAACLPVLPQHHATPITSKRAACPLHLGISGHNAAFRLTTGIG